MIKVAKLVLQSLGLAAKAAKDRRQGKIWYKSETLWWNALALVIVGLQMWQSSFVVSPEAQVGIIALLNMILRLVTKEAVEWTLKPPAPPVNDAKITDVGPPK